jgi:hypothetical protein
MPRTTWQDLAGDDTPPDRQALIDEALGSSGAGDALRSLGARGGEGASALPSSLDDIPQLQSLLAERRRLEQTLQQLTGAGSAAPPQGDRDARRFPMAQAEPSSSRLALRRQEQAEERARAEERRAMELETLDQRNAQRRDETRRRDLAERAARRREAGERRVAQAAQAWERHRDHLVTARDTARDLARLGRGLGLPGADVADRAARRLQSMTDGLDRIDRAVREAGSLAGGGGSAGRDGAARSSEGDGALGRLREIARDARRFIDDPLRDTTAGRRLHALRDELAPPQLRPMRGEAEDGAGDVNVLEQRRQRALQALRERRAADAPARGSSAARSGEPALE